MTRLQNIGGEGGWGGGWVWCVGLSKNYLQYIAITKYKAQKITHSSTQIEFEPTNKRRGSA